MVTSLFAPFTVKVAAPFRESNSRFCALTPNPLPNVTEEPSARLRKVTRLAVRFWLMVVAPENGKMISVIVGAGPQNAFAAVSTPKGSFCPPMTNVVASICAAPAL